MISQFSSKELIAIAAILLVIITLMVGFYMRFSNSFGEDVILNAPSLSQMYGGMFVWTPMNYSGFPTPAWGVFGYLFFSLDLLLFAAFGAALGNILYAAIGIWIGAVGMFLLVSEFCSDKHTSMLAGLASVSLFSFVIGFHLNAFVGGAYFIPWVFLFAYRLHTDVRHGYKVRMNLFGMTLASSLFVAFSSVGFLLQGLVFLLLFSALLLLLCRRKRLKLAPLLLASISIAYLINASWIVTSYTFIQIAGNQYFNAASLSDILSNPIPPNIFTAMASFNPGNADAWEAAQNIHQNLLAVFLLATSALGSYLYIKSNAPLESRHILLIALSLMLVLMAFLSGIGKPFGIAFTWLVTNVPYTLVLRAGYGSLYPFVNFLIPFIFGMAIAAMYSHLKARMRILLIYSVVAVITLSIGLFDLPAQQQATAAQGFTYSIPKYVTNISDYINVHGPGSVVAFLPIPDIMNGWQYDTWYNGTNVYSCFVHVPVYTGGWNCYNEMFFPQSKSQYSKLVDMVANGSEGGDWLANRLSLYGVRYIIYDGAAINPSNEILSALASANSLTLLGDYNGTMLYENHGYKPLVYASDVAAIDGHANVPVMNDIMASNAIISGMSVYDASSIGFFNSTGKMDVMAIPGFEQPTVSFLSDNPVEVTVNVINATTPYYLIFRETYDSHWAASYGNGMAISALYHIQVNGYANAWYVNKTGSYTITLYYTLQTDAWFSLALSLVGIAILLYIGLLAYKEIRAKKSRR